MKTLMSVFVSRSLAPKKPKKDAPFERGVNRGTLNDSAGTNQYLQETA